jgi:hypothetical protein
MDPISAVTLGLSLLDKAVSWIEEIKAQTGMTVEQILAHADTQDLANKEAIKSLLAS